MLFVGETRVEDGSRTVGNTREVRVENGASGFRRSSEVRAEVGKHPENSVLKEYSRRDANRKRRATGKILVSKEFGRRGSGRGRRADGDVHFLKEVVEEVRVEDRNSQKKNLGSVEYENGKFTDITGSETDCRVRGTGRERSDTGRVRF